MEPFDVTDLPEQPDAVAPDGSEVRLLARLAGGSMAHFRLPAGEISRAVTHRTVSEIWYVVDGTGEIWLGRDGRGDVVELRPGRSFGIPVGTGFQFRSGQERALSIVGVTMPPWPGEDEAVAHHGPWEATVG